MKKEPKLYLGKRQIHLDFHTSGLIPEVAKDFKADDFVEQLKMADVTGICVFAKCHHGYAYYPTRFGKQHPTMQSGRDLLGEQLEALKSANIQTSIYTTIAWDELAAKEHPEWLTRTITNKVMSLDHFSLLVSPEELEKQTDASGQVHNRLVPGWSFLCWNTPYREYLKEQFQEIVARYETEYLFMDILFHTEACVCASCVERMQRHGLNPNSPKDREKNQLDSAREFMDFMNSAIHEIQPHLPTFYNSRLRLTGRVEEGSYPEMEQMGAIIVESLPSGPWGYDHFPVFAKYFQNFDYAKMGHTGKFQKMWGDFGGLKNEAALEYEVMRMVSQGYVPSIGDQLPPRGTLDPPTYALIGKTFAKVKVIEDYLIPSTPIDEIGIFLSNAPKKAKNIGADLGPEYGAMKMLMQGQYQFSFLDEESDFERYPLLILPDEITITPKLQIKLNAYLKQGGKLIVSYESGFDGTSKKFALDDMDLQIKGEHPHKPYYVFATNSLKDSGDLEETDHVQYLGGKEVRWIPEHYEVLAGVTEPYFNRSWQHFCSHLQTPPHKSTGAVEMFYNQKNIIYIASPIFRSYHKFASKMCKSMVYFAIDTLMKTKLVLSNLPSTAEVTLRQSQNQETMLSILHYIHQRRGEGIDIVEDIIPLYDINISLFKKEEVSEVVDVCTRQSLAFKRKGERIEFTIPKIEGFIVLKIN